MIIKFVKLHEDAIGPTYGTSEAAGADLYAYEDCSLYQGARFLMPTGIAVQIPRGYAGFIQPRSGLAAKHGITVLNTPGLIDSDYRGELKVILYATANHNNSAYPCIINKGDRIAQLVIQQIVAPGFVEVSNLDDSMRGNGGFGSTG